jgi:hypothetical protein
MHRAPARPQRSALGLLLRLLAAMTLALVLLTAAGLGIASLATASSIAAKPTPKPTAAP